MDKKKSIIPDQKVLKDLYESRKSFYDHVLFSIQERMTREIRENSLKSTIKTRIKSFDSYYDKLLLRMKKQKDSDEVISINDILGIRIVCPFRENLNIIENLIRNNYEVIESEDKGSRYSFKEFGYSAVHIIIKIPDEFLGDMKKEEGLVCEVQLCTILQDAWAEVEHELVYKSLFTPFDDSLKRKLAAVNANLTLSDILFQEILDYQRSLHRQLKKRKDAFFNIVEDRARLLKDNEKTIEDSDGITSKDEADDMNFDITNPAVFHDMDSLLLKALELHNDSKYTEAIEIYTRILNSKLLPNIMVPVLIHRGMAHFGNSQYDRAIDDFSSAINIESENYKALYYRSIVQSVLSNYQLALFDLDRCIELEPFKSELYFSRAQVYYHLIDYPHALSDCEQALTIEPDSEKIKKFREVIKAGIDMYNIIT